MSLNRSLKRPGSWRRVGWALLFLTCLGARLYRMEFQCATRDECFSWRLIQYPIAEQIRRTAEDVHPPLYYLLLSAWSACWGTSLYDLRLMSVAMTIAATPFVFLAVKKSLKTSDLGAPAAINGACFATVVVGLHVVELDAARNARMYGLGILLSAVSAWLLLHALDKSGYSVRWWLAYGLTASALCYTHNYGLFTVLAQVVFGAALLIYEGSKGNRAYVRGHGGGYLAALAVIAGSYVPWSGVLETQVRTVQEGYWIGKPTIEQLRHAFYSWSTGLVGSGWVEFWLWVALLVGSAGFATWRRFGGAVTFWMLQISVPWAASLCMSFQGGTPIFQERYLAFAHVGLLGLLGVCFAAIPTLPLRLLVGWLLLAPCILGAWERLAAYSRDRPAIAQAMKFVSDRHEPGDRILAHWHGEVNRLRYYAFEAGISDPDVRCISNGWSGRGHTVHAASFGASDILAPSELTGRLWQVEPYTPRPIPGAEIIVQHRFQGSGDITEYQVRLCRKRRE